MFNNVVYNWNSRTTDGGAKEMQFVNNYYKMGPDTKQAILFSADNETGGDRDQFAYVSGNIRDNRSGSLTEDKLGDTYRATGPQPEKAWVGGPFWPSYAAIESAKSAYQSVLSDVGANQPSGSVCGDFIATTSNDLTDQRILSETLNRSYTYVGSKSGIKGEIDDELDAGGFEDYPETAWPADYDFDNDGLPNWWEELRGTNPRSRTLNYADTNRDSEGDGYTELERYLDFMAQPHVWLAPGTEASIDLKTLFRGFSDNVQLSIINSRTRAALPYSISYSDGNVITLQAGDQKALDWIDIIAADMGGSYTRRLFIAITDNRSVQSSQFTVQSSQSTVHSVYDLQGRRMESSIFNLQSSMLKKGIYIVDGKKVVVSF